MKILVLCTGNTCRSQMAAGFLRSFDKRLIVKSAGTEPAAEVNPFAVTVMKEKGIDISDQKPTFVAEYIDEEWDYVITVCDDANEKCPVFTGKVKHRLHHGFEDPAKVTGTKDFVLNEYRRIRDLIEITFREFYNTLNFSNF